MPRVQEWRATWPGFVAPREKRRSLRVLRGAVVMEADKKSRGIEEWMCRGGNEELPME